MNEKHKLPHDATPDVHEFHHPPQSVQDIVNQWGTYNVQATSDTENLFPLVGPALPRRWRGLHIGKPEIEDLP